MALILPGGPAFTSVVDNLTGTAPQAVPGTNFTAAANNADGTAVAVLGALAFDVHYLVIGIGGITLTGANSQALLDVLNDPAGGTAWVSLIDDLVCGFTPIPAGGPNASIQTYYHFPLFVRAGNTIGVRCRTLHTVDITTGRVIIWAYGNPTRPEMWWCGQKVESLGINAASSSGTAVTPGNSGADGTWTTIGVSTGKYSALQLGLNGSDGTALAIGYYWQVGVGSQRLPGFPTLYGATTTAECTSRSGFCMPMWCDVPSGSTLQVRGSASGTGEIYNLAIYGVM
jgi:hypothetical protein